MSCAKSNENDTLIDTQSNNVSPNNEMLIAVIGYIQAEFGPLLAIDSRTLITYSENKIDYCIKFTKADSTKSGIAFKLVDIIDDVLTQVSSPGYFLCSQENSFCYDCELEKPTSQDPYYYCSCKTESHPGGGNGACSLIECPGPNPASGFVGTYLQVGINIIETIPFAEIEYLDL